jgi:hypothetical protein
MFGHAPICSLAIGETTLSAIIADVILDTHDFVPSFWFEQWNKNKNKTIEQAVEIIQEQVQQQVKEVVPVKLIKKQITQPINNVNLLAVINKLVIYYEDLLEQELEEEFILNYLYG